MGNSLVNIKDQQFILFEQLNMEKLLADAILIIRKRDAR